VRSRRRAGSTPARSRTSLAAREKLGSTGLGQGIAIPHGRIKGLKQARGAFVRLHQPVAFDAPDGKPVSQVFVLLVPEAIAPPDHAHLHLGVLSTAPHFLLSLHSSPLTTPPFFYSPP
jgi:mannitol/fructose-specific phosphotransferase system IIA component (Ntr-type)